MTDNIILQTDSYKLTHYDMYPDGTTGVFSYLEARPRGQYDRTLWFGLQYYLKRYLDGVRVTADMIAEAEALCAAHFSRAKFNAAGWLHILRKHGGRLPVRICAAPEGSVIPCGNVLMTIENTDPVVPWLTNAIESLLLKVWYPTTVATRSWHMRVMLEDAVRRTGGQTAMYMLHDFGYRGSTSEEAAQIGGAAHLINFCGSDTVPAIRWAREYYGAPADVAASVVASEHSVMTSCGRDGEIALARRIIEAHPNEIVSLVADSFDYYNFVRQMAVLKDTIVKNNVRLVIRPDSITGKHQTPADLVRWTLHELAALIGSEVTRTGHKVVPYGILWGDGIDETGVRRILDVAIESGYAASNLVFGMGGGLLQKLDRDTCRFAIKCSARRDANTGWMDVGKDTPGKQSMRGRLTLARVAGGKYRTMTTADVEDDDAIVMRPVFENGLILRQDTFEQIRARAAAAIVAESVRSEAVTAA